MARVIHPSLERAAFSKGIELIAGIDEVGVGCAAGPIVACCAIFDRRIIGEEGIQGLNPR